MIFPALCHNDKKMALPVSTVDNTDTLLGTLALGEVAVDYIADAQACPDSNFQ